MTRLGEFWWSLIKGNRRGMAKPASRELLNSTPNKVRLHNLICGDLSRPKINSKSATCPPKVSVPVDGVKTAALAFSFHDTGDYFANLSIIVTILAKGIDKVSLVCYKIV